MVKTTMKDPQSFRELLIKKGFSLRSFAKLADIGEATLTQILNGKRFPSPKTAFKITTALKVNFDDVFAFKHNFERETNKDGEKTDLE